MLVSTAMRPVTAQAEDSASIASTASSQPLPWPPYRSGMVMPRSLASFSSSTLSQGYCSVRSTSAARPATGPTASSRTRACSFTWSGDSPDAFITSSLAKVVDAEDDSGIAAAAHSDTAEVGEDELVATGLARALRDENARTIILVQLFEPRREIDRVAEQREGQALAGADRSADHVARADADAGDECPAHVAEGAAADGALDVDGGAHRGAGMII